MQIDPKRGRGRPRKSEASVNVCFRTSVEQYIAMRDRALANKESHTALIERAIARELARKSK